jgi:hypothetical protein
VHPDSRPPSCASNRNDDIDALRRPLQAPERRSGPMAQQRLISTAQHRPQPTPVPADIRAANRIYAPPEGMKTSVGDAMSDCRRAQSMAEELSPRDDSVLPVHQPPKLTGTTVKLFGRHNNHKASRSKPLPRS